MSRDPQLEQDRDWALHSIAGMVGDMVTLDERFLGWTVEVETGGILVMHTPWNTEIRVGVSSRECDCR